MGISPSYAIYKEVDIPYSPQLDCGLLFVIYSIVRNTVFHPWNCCRAINGYMSGHHKPRRIQNGRSLMSVRCSHNCHGNIGCQGFSRMTIRRCCLRKVTHRCYPRYRCNWLMYVQGLCVWRFGQVYPVPMWAQCPMPKL